MSVYLLGRGLKNSGDYLIVNSTKNLLEYLKFKINFVNTSGNLRINDKELKNINSCDYLIIAGGPCLKEKIYGAIYPLRTDLNDIKAQIILFGCGRAPIYNFTSKDIMFLKRCIIFTRDINTQKMLQDYNIKSHMYGCSVWYNYGNIVKSMKSVDIKNNKILFSTSINPDKFNDLKFLKLLINTTNKNNIIICINHGINHPGFKNSLILAYIKTNNIEYYDTNSNWKLMKELTTKVNCHVGFRLHNHLLALSMGVKSFLINIDNRGVDMCDTLGNNYCISYINSDNFEENLNNALKSDYGDVINTITNTFEYINTNFKNLIN